MQAGDFTTGEMWPLFRSPPPHQPRSVPWYHLGSGSEVCCFENDKADYHPHEPKLPAPAQYKDKRRSYEDPYFWIYPASKLNDPHEDKASLNMSLCSQLSLLGVAGSSEQPR